MQRRRPHAGTDSKTVVARSPILTIEACSCGIFHLHFGALSMRFTEESLAQVRRCIDEALVPTHAPEAVGSGMLSATGPVRGQA